MNRKLYKKLIYEGEYAAEVEIERIESGNGWGPYLSLDDAQKLDEVRDALRIGNLKKAVKTAKVFRLVPVAA